MTARFQGRYVSIPRDDPETTARGLYFEPLRQARACVLMLPGSGGGVGPGIERAPQPFSAAPTRRCHGGIYLRLCHELATGAAHSWAYKRERDAAYGGDVAALMVDWSVIPRRRLRRLWMLESAVEDAVAGARWLLDRHAGARLVVVGFSFGGPALWAALDRLSAAFGARLAGAASVAGSARGGETFAAFDTAACVARFAATGRPTLFLHGSHDKNVALQVSELLHGRAVEAQGRSTLVVINRAAHLLDTARDVAYRTLRDWIAAALDGPPAEAETVRLGAEPRRPWRAKPSRRRLRKVAAAPGHPLRGLVGYSE